MAKLEVKVGERFGNLTVVSEVPMHHFTIKDGTQRKQTMVICRCDCGKETTRSYAKLRAVKKRGKQETISCGRCKKVFGVGIYDLDFRGRRRPLNVNAANKTWRSMLQRCYDNKHGCKNDFVVCDEWLIFSNYFHWFEDNYNGHGKYYQMQIKNKDIKKYAPDNVFFKNIETDKRGGVYLIKYLPQSVVYVGKSNNIHLRWLNHKEAIRDGRHENFGSFTSDIGDYSFEVLEYCDESQLSERERYWYDQYKDKYEIVNKIKPSPKATFKSLSFNKTQTERILQYCNDKGISGREFMDMFFKSFNDVEDMQETFRQERELGLI